MSEENVEIVRSIFAPLEGVNIAEIDWSEDALRELLGRGYSPDVELNTLQSGLGAGVDLHYRGLDGLVRYLKEWLEPFSDYRVEVLDYIDAGDCVLLPSHQWGIGSGSGAKVELDLTTLYEVRDGLIVRMHQYDTVDEALADARSVG